MFNKELKKFICGLLLTGALLFSGFALPVSAQSQPPEEPESGEPEAPNEFELHAHSHEHNFILFLPALVTQETETVDISGLAGIPDQQSDELAVLAGRTVTYPSGSRFSEVTNPVGGTNYSDPVANGEVPLIDLNGRTGEKLSSNFTAREFQTNDGARYARISDRLVTNLQKMRSNTGRSISINSGYRHPSYNAGVGGAAQSQHMSGKAADIKVSGLTALQMADEAIKAFGCSNLGIGLGASYIHVDVRFGRSTWVYGGAAKSGPAFKAYVDGKCSGGTAPPTVARCLSSPIARTVPTAPNKANYIGGFTTSSRCSDINVKFSTTKFVYVISSDGRHSGWKYASANRWITPLTSLPTGVTWQMWTYDFSVQSTRVLLDS